VSFQPVGCSLDTLNSPTFPGQDTIAQSVAAPPDTSTQCAFPAEENPHSPTLAGADQVLFCGQANNDPETNAIPAPGDTVFSCVAGQSDTMSVPLQGTTETATSLNFCAGETFNTVVSCSSPQFPSGLTWLEQNILWTLNSDLWGAAFSNFTGCQNNG